MLLATGINHVTVLSGLSDKYFQYVLNFVHTSPSCRIPILSKMSSGYITLPKPPKLFNLTSLSLSSIKGCG